MLKKTYVIEVDGKPEIAFRAADDEEAARKGGHILSAQRSYAVVLRKEGDKVPADEAYATGIIRIATIPEQELWRKDAIRCQNMELELQVEHSYVKDADPDDHIFWWETLSWRNDEHGQDN